MDYEEIRANLRTVESESLTPKLRNELNNILWKAEKYDRIKKIMENINDILCKAKPVKTSGEIPRVPREVK